MRTTFVMLTNIVLVIGMVPLVVMMLVSIVVMRRSFGASIRVNRTKLGPNPSGLSMATMSRFVEASPPGMVMKPTGFVVTTPVTGFVNRVRGGGAKAVSICARPRQ